MWDQFAGEFINNFYIGIIFFLTILYIFKLKGRPFYAVQGKALCEVDYLETLEKCCVCNDPILDRILRATGKPYHPRCFTCVMCQKSLDGIPFTVDAVNRIHCIEDFHKRYNLFLNFFIQIKV